MASLRSVLEQHQGWTKWVVNVRLFSCGTGRGVNTVEGEAHNPDGDTSVVNLARRVNSFLLEGTTPSVTMAIRYLSLYNGHPL